MRQLDLFGTVQETNPEGNVEKTANQDLHVVHMKEIENEVEEKAAEPTTATTEKNETHEKVPSKEIIPQANRLKTTSKKELAGQDTKESKRGRKSYKQMEAEAENLELPDDELLFQKQYYSISEVAQWFKVNTSLVRYWENEFDILKPRKTRKGDRLFRPEDVKNLHVIYYLLRQRKFSIEGAKQYLKESKAKADAQMMLVQSLTKFRSFLLEWKAILGA
jgi:DNA-binding transcriptional MerR regulator